MRVLVTGADGFFGKYVSKRIAADRKIKIFKTSRKKKKNFISIDLNNNAALHKILNSLRPDIIVNLAAYVQFKNPSKTEKKKIYNTNCNLVKVLSKYCKKNKAHIIQASTVISTKKAGVFFSTDRIGTKADDYYRKTKIQAEKIITRSKCSYSILRFGGVFGLNGPSHLFLNKAINYLLNNKKVIYEGNLLSKRNYLYAGDAADFIYKFIKSKKNGIYGLQAKILNFKYMFRTIESLINKKKIIYKKNNSKIHNQIIIGNYKFKCTSFKKAIKQIIKDSC